MTKLPDHAARLRALTELTSTLLVEAAAGTGKTALMAGRLTMLLAQGAAPRSIAAITFAELAASALRARVHRYIDALLDGRVPEPLRLALPDGLTDAQRLALSTAAQKLDELTAPPSMPSAKPSSPGTRSRPTSIQARGSSTLPRPTRPSTPSSNNGFDVG
jgi:UvrD/REP helicase N-terminal domain